KLAERLADALRGTAVRLSLYDHRVDGAPDVVDPRVAHHIETTGLRVDFDLADVGAVRKAKLLDRFIAACGKRPGQSLGHGFAVRGRLGDVEKPDRAVGAFDGEAAGGEADVVFGRFQHVRSDSFALLDDRVGRLAHDDAGETH